MDTPTLIVLGFAITWITTGAGLGIAYQKLAGRLDGQKDKTKLAIVAHEKDCSNYDPNTGIRAVK